MDLPVSLKEIITIFAECWGYLLGILTLISFFITLYYGKKASVSERKDKERYIDYGQEALVVTTFLKASLGWFPFFKKYFRFVQLDSVDPGCDVVVYMWDMEKRIMLEKGVDWFSDFKKIGRGKGKRVQERIFLNNSQSIKERFAASEKIEIDLEIWKTYSREQIRENVETKTSETIEGDYTMVTVSVKNNGHVRILDYEIVYAIPSIKSVKLINAKAIDVRGKTSTLKTEAKNCSVRLDIPYDNISPSCKKRITDFSDFTIRISANLEPGIFEIKFKYSTPK